MLICFNPRPHMGGDLDELAQFWHLVHVSIHAPTWGATSRAATAADSLIWFQSTPPHGGRLDLYAFVVFKFQFQSTPPHGGRLAAVDGRFIAAEVSIHAPTWGATTQASVALAGIDSFNPRPHMGGDTYERLSEAVSKWFQSTPPHGGRQALRPNLEQF